MNDSGEPQISVTHASRATPGANGKYDSHALGSPAIGPRSNAIRPLLSLVFCTSAAASTLKPTFEAATAIAWAAVSVGEVERDFGSSPGASCPVVAASSPLAVNAPRIVPRKTGTPLGLCASSTQAMFPEGFT